MAGKKEISASQSDISLPVNDGENLGKVVANAGDIDEDGTTDLAVGLPFDDDAERTVALYLYSL